MPSGIKRETWRPQPTSSWAPSQNDSFRPTAGESSTSTSGRYSPTPPSGPSSGNYRTQASSTYRPDEERDTRGRDRHHDRDEERGRHGRDAGWGSRKDDDRRGNGRRSPADDDRGGDVGRYRDPSSSRDAQSKRGYGRDYNEGLRVEDLRKGTFRTKAQIERDKRGHATPSQAHRDHRQGGSYGGGQGDRSWSAWKDRVDEVDRRQRPDDRGLPPPRRDNGFTRGSASPRKARSPSGSSSYRYDRGQGEGERGGGSVRGRRTSPDYGDRMERKRSPSQDS